MEDHFTLHIRGVGHWTNRLYELVGEQFESEETPRRSLPDLIGEAIKIDFQITRSTPKQGQPTDMPNWSRRQVFNYRRTSADKYVEMITLKKKIRAENIRLNTAQDFCNYFQNQFDMIGTKLEIGLKKERIYISRKETEQYDLVDFRLTLSPYLCNILGFTRGTSKSHKLKQ